MREPANRRRTGGRVLADPARPVAVILAARRWIGTPYVLCAALRGVGCDCVGLIRGVLADVTGRPVPDVPGWRQDWAEAPGRPLFTAAARHLIDAPHPPRPGDVVAFRVDGREAHVGILSTGGRVIHAVEGCGVVEVPLDAWRGRISFRAAFPAAR